MNYNVNSRSGEELSLWDWLGAARIKIPMMQRDYAQGRKGLHYLRERFLKSVFDSLRPNADQQHIKLDFVYGKEEEIPEDSNLLLVTPIDGQQRLTTLWLLHWYVAMRSGKIKEPSVIERLQRFTYDTRQSSKKFCESLVENGKEIDKLMSDARIGVADSIRRQTWYRNSWNCDTTVVGMLMTLSGDSHAPASCKDGIEKWCEGISDKRFVDIWNRLVSKPSECPISFYFQSLDGIGDADGLYVKMNARGKSLTAFENFKAELSDFAAERVRRGEHVTIWSDVPSKLDTEWSDIFWMAPEEDDVGQVRADDRYLAFIRRLVFNDIVTEKSGNGEYQVGNDVKGFSEDLRDSTDFYHFFEGRCVYDSFDRYDEAFSRFSKIKSVMDYVAKKNAEEFARLIKECTPSWFGESQSSWLERISFVPTTKDFVKDGSFWRDAITQPGRVWFLAIARFFEQAIDLDDNSLSEALKNWLRVVANIIENADINTMGSMISTMRLIDELSRYSRDILSFLSNPANKIESGASAEQIKEEREKAGGMKEHRDEILEAEGEFFNKGMIRYLYRKNETPDWTCFGGRRKNMKKLFRDKGFPEKGTVPRFAAGFTEQGLKDGVYKSIAFIPGNSQRSAASWKKIFRDMHDKNCGGICRQQLEKFIDGVDEKVDVSKLNKVILLLVKALESMEREGSGLQTLVTRVLTNWTAKVGTRDEATYNYVLTDYANRQARPNNGLFINLCGTEEAMKCEIERYGRCKGCEGANENNDDNQNSKVVLQKNARKNSTNHDENNQNDIEIVLYPSDPKEFKSELLRTRRASRTLVYGDGYETSDVWKADKFTETSNLMTNIKTSKAYENAKINGIIRLVFEIKDASNNLNESKKGGVDDLKSSVTVERDQDIVRSDNRKEYMNDNNSIGQPKDMISDAADELKSENENECISKEFIREVMSIPSCSGKERMMKKYIWEFAEKRGIDIYEDEKGNLYLTKGNPTKDGGCYPCIVNHMDTVQKHEQYVEHEELLKVSERTNNKGQVELYVDGTGIGADDKLGCAIALALIDKLPVVKAVFFVEEELRMAGSKCLSVEWFKDVGFCLSFDSPERNRTSKICGGERLFSDKFFEDVLKPICVKHGITEFKDEPYTDVVQIRKKTPIMCYNVGNGGYNAHRSNEYLIVEDAQAAYKFGLDLLSNIRENRYWFSDN